MDSKKNRFAALTLAGAVFAINCFLFAYFFDAEEQGFVDTQRGIDQYNSILDVFGLPRSLTVVDLFEVRIVQILLTVILLGALLFTNLIKIEHMSLYLLWPYSAFLATKIKQEFLLFPLAFIDLASTWQRELVISSSIILFSAAVGEKNGVIIVAFRLAAFVMVRLPRNKALALLVIGIVTCIIADKNFSRLATIFPPIASYNYTREVVNPEYSIIESAGVFLASLHLGITPPLDYWYAIPFSILALGFGLLTLRESDSDEKLVFWRSIMASAIVYVLFTSLTHAFQNARYYYFVVLMLFPRLDNKSFLALFILSLLHTLFAVYVYEVTR